MFSFKKIKQKKQIVTSAIIAEIHNEFDTATERLLIEAKDVISKSDTGKVEKANRLNKLGFSQSKPVIETAEQKEAARKSKQVSDAIIYYQGRYPNNKFITENEVEKICKKYKLVCGEVRYYRGDVPEKNLKEIEQFQLHDEEKETEMSYSRDSANSFGTGLLGMSQNPLFNHASLEYLFRSQQNARPRYVAEPTGNRIKAELKICAPVSDFDTTRMVVSESYKLVETPIPDPIVLQPVKHGYLIISKWGLEASDEVGLIKK